MGTAVVESPLIVRVPPEVLGVGSEYDKRRLALKGGYAQIVLEAKKVTAVETPEDLEKANSLGRMLQAGSKDVEAFFKPVKQQIDSIKKPILDHERELAGELDTEKSRLGTLITGYNRKVEAQRQEEERIAREQAEAAAREELLARAVELDAAGDAEAAEAVLDEPVMAPVVIQQKAPPKMSGQVGKTVYSCRVENVKALMQAVLDGKAPAQCFSLDQGFLNKKAALEKESFQLAGCKLDRQNSTHFRS